MKLQRYDLEVYLTSQFPVPEKDENGDWCKAEDCAALEAENERLRAKLARYENDGTTHATGCWAWGPKHYECALAEIERLKTSPKVLEPEEVKKDGAYWFQRRGGTAWTVIYVFPRLEVRDGLYIGPLPPPEV